MNEGILKLIVEQFYYFESNLKEISLLKILDLMLFLKTDLSSLFAEQVLSKISQSLRHDMM